MNTRLGAVETIVDQMASLLHWNDRRQRVEGNQYWLGTDRRHAFESDRQTPDKA